MKKFLTLSLAFGIFAISSAFKKPQDGGKLPEISLKNLAGENVNVADYGKSGKITVFSFWATWCGPCKKELKAISELLDEWEEKYNMQLVAVSTDNSRNTVKVKPFVDGQGWDFDVLLDTNEDFKRAVNATNIPFTLVVDEKGNIVYTHLGYIAGDEFELEDKLKEISAKK